MQHKKLSASIQTHQPATPPRLRTVYILAGLFAFSAVGQAFRLLKTNAHPFSNWMTDAPRWYDHLSGLLVSGSACAACVFYARYRWKLLKLGQAAKVRPWRERHEVRAVLYLLATALIVQLPIGCWRTFIAWRDPQTPEFAMNLISLFPTSGWLYPCIGIAAIIYDRRRATHEYRELENRCVVCGYDLRASTGRCPECGATRETPIGNTATS